jgi:hypothetical protein
MFNRFEVKSNNMDKSIATTISFTFQSGFAKQSFFALQGGWYAA